jgi:hypothetical protein
MRATIARRPFAISADSFFLRTSGSLIEAAMKPKMKSMPTPRKP